jgi:hypothetical protein
LDNLTKNSELYKDSLLKSERERIKLQSKLINYKKTKQTLNKSTDTLPIETQTTNDKRIDVDYQKLKKSLKDVQCEYNTLKTTTTK